MCKDLAGKNKSFVLGYQCWLLGQVLLSQCQMTGASAVCSLFVFDSFIPCISGQNSLWQRFLKCVRQDDFRWHMSKYFDF